MKGLTKFFAGAFAVAILASCSSGGGAEKVATDYLTALKENNVAKAKELGTTDTQQMLDQMSQLNMLPTIEEVKDVKCTEEGETAKCTYCCTKGGNDELTLKKEGDKWLVDEKKETGGTESAPIEEPAPADSGATSEVPAEGAPAEAPATK